MTPENKKELTKKIAIILILGLLFFFARTFYMKENKPLPPKTPKTKINKIATSKDSQAAQEEKKFQKLFSPSYIRSSDKNELIKLAAQNAGKKDPFVNNALKQKKSAITNQALANSNFVFPNSSMNVLPPASGDLSTFSTLPDIQNMISDELVLKGFIGNKAIISYKGSNKAVFVNQNFEDIKITKIIPNDRSIEYLKKGKKHFTQLKTVNNENIVLTGVLTNG